jgi:hypothetical protein
VASQLIGGSRRGMFRQVVVTRKGAELHGPDALRDQGLLGGLRHPHRHIRIAP